MATLEQLFSLLDDENDQVAQSAMSELLKREDELSGFLRDLHESPNPLVRRRVHQLEAIVTIRRRRKEFSHLLNQSEVDLVEGLVEVHLLWYDNDSQPALFELFAQFSDSARKYGITRLSRLGDFMRKGGFAVSPDSELLNPDNFCLGPTLEDRVGSELLLCLIALEVAAEEGLELGLVRTLGHFALVDSSGNMLLPQNSWQLGKIEEAGQYEVWNEPAKVLKYLALMLLLAAVGSDSFRYIHTIAASILGHTANSDWDFLPYPYRPT